MRLVVTGDLNAGAFDAILHRCQPCVQGQDQQLALDLSGVEWGNPSGLVPFAGLIRTLASRGVEVSVEAYPDESVCGYFCRMNLFEIIGVNSPCRDAKRQSGEGRFIEITELRHPQIEADNRTKLTGLLQRLPKGIEATEVSRNSFIDACGEVVSNTRHAYNGAVDANVATRPPALIQAQFYPKLGRVEFCVCDAGLGIKRSMEGEHEGAFRTHLDAITGALAFMNQGPLEEGAGLGLAALESYVKKNGGILRIRSGDALRVRRGGKGASSTQELPCWDGTIVTIEILVEKNADLSRIWKRMAK